MPDLDKIYVSVILPLRLEWEPVYCVPEEIAGSGSVNVGDRVTVRFAARLYSGVVSAVNVTPAAHIKKVFPIVSLDKNLDPVSVNELKLWRFVADYYLCSVGEVFKAAYPALKINLEESRARAAERRQRIIDKKKEALKARRAKLVASLEQRLARAEAETGPKAKERLEASVQQLRERIAALTEAVSSLESVGTQAEADVEAPASSGFSLSAAQKEALTSIRDGFSSGKPVLLDGVTGSGKTEIYISLALDAISKGRNVLYMVPEIAVSRQLEERLKRIFGDMLLTFHSKESSASRVNVAEAMKSRQYVVLGTRSSIFLPHHDLGVVIVDEEHDSSYKQDAPAPRYNGRDTALMLAKLNRADVVLGSATPSLESLYNCKTGKMAYVRLSERYFGAEDSDVEIIDTIAERRKRGMKGSFSYKLIERINEVLSDGGQILLLRARRAYSPAVQCVSCGDIPRCPHCNVPLSYHRQEGVLMCHYCGWRTPFDAKCGKCGGALEPVGAGTQKIEEEAAALFPSARIVRLDSDTASAAGRENEIIREFSQKKIDILVGTQIIAKGFDFDGLSMVAVIGADSLVGQQDFRADERSVQLLEQFRGRCGRRGEKGLFVIQTAQPSHPVYRVFARSDENGGDVKSLMDNMLSERFQFGYPPFSRIVKIIVKDTDEGRLDRMSLALAGALRSRFGVPVAGFVQGSNAGITVTGPFAPPVDKQSDSFIRDIRVSLRKDKSLASNKSALASTVSSFEAQYSYAGHVALDVDPL